MDAEPDHAGSAGTAVPPGSGWPDDPATRATPVARSAAAVSELARGAATMAELAARQSVCRACPRLVAWREQTAAVKRRSFQGERYWGRPVPGWATSGRGCLSSGWRPPPTEATGRAGSSLATAAATGCSARSTAAGSRPGRRAWRRAMASGYSACGWPRRSAARRQRTGRHHRSVTPAPRGSPRSLGRWRTACG